MKRTLLLLLIILFTLFKYILVEGKILTGDKILIKEPSAEEIFAAGDEITITTEMKNEFIGIGRRIIADTDVNGDFIGIGFTLTFKGTANQDIYLIGNAINAEGSIDGSMTIVGRNMQIKTSVGGNIRASAERIQIESVVKGKTIIWGKDVFLAGEFNDVVVYGNRIRFAPDILIKGNLTYNTPEQMDLSGIKILGEIKWNRPITEKAKEMTHITLLKRFYTFFSLLFSMMFMLWFFPNLFKQTATISGKKFLACFGMGTFFIILTLIALPIIFITIIGAPIGLIVAFTFFSSLYISRIFPAIFIGRMVLFKMQERTLTWVFATLIGIFLFTTLCINPTARILVNLISIPAGFGALFLGRAGFIKHLRKEKIL